jgi:hypothetical protein
MGFNRKFVLVLLFLQMAAVSVRANTCPAFYAGDYLSQAQNISQLKDEMEKIATQFLQSLQLTDGLTLQSHAHVITTFKALSKITGDINQFNKAFSIITFENPDFKESMRLSSNFVKNSEILNEDIKILLNKRAKNKSKNIIDAEQALKVKDSYDAIKWTLTEFRTQVHSVPKMNAKLAEEYDRILEFESNLEVYYNRLAFFTQALSTKGASYPESAQKLNSLLGLFYESTQTAHRDLEQIRNLKLLVDQQSTNNGIALHALQHESRLDLPYYLMKNGLAPQESRDLAAEIVNHVSNRASIEKKSIEKKQFRQNFIAGLKSKARAAVITLSAVGALGGSYLGYDHYADAKDARVATSVQQIKQTLASPSNSNELLMAKYVDQLPPDIRDYAIQMKSPSTVKQALASSNGPLEPGAIVYLVNYAPSLYSTQTLDWAGFQTVLNTVLLKKVSREYTPQEKADLISSVRTYRENWEAVLKKQYELGIIDESEMKESLVFIKQGHDDTLKTHLAAYGIEQAALAKKKEVEDAKLKKAEEEKAQASALYKKPRHLLATAAEIDAVSNELAHPVLKAIFATKDQNTVAVQLKNYAEKNPISNSDLVFILNQTVKFEPLVAIVKTAEVDNFERRILESEGRYSAGDYRPVSQTAFALSYVLNNLKLEPMGAAEALHIKTKLDNHLMFKRDYNNIQNNKVGGQSYKNHLSTALNEKIKVKKD